MQGIIFAPARLTARVLGSVSNNQSTCSWHSQRENWVSSLFSSSDWRQSCCSGAQPRENGLALTRYSLILSATNTKIFS